MDKKYWVKGEWIFNLESMNDKLWCMIYDMRDGKLCTPIDVAGSKVNDEDDVLNLIDECGDLEMKAKRGKVTWRDYGRIKSIVDWRVGCRYVACLNGGMSEKEAGMCFGDI